MNHLSTTMRPWAIGENGTCPVAETLRTLGGKHKPQILHCLMGGEVHFLELTRQLGGVSRKILTEQLRDLQAAGLIRRRQKDDARRRVGYSLTETGRALVPILGQINDWALAHAGDGAAAG